MLLIRNYLIHYGFFNNFPTIEQSEENESVLKIAEVYSEGNNNYLLTILLTLKDTLSIEFTYNESLMRKEYVEMFEVHIKKYTQTAALMKNVVDIKCPAVAGRCGKRKIIKYI